MNHASTKYEAALQGRSLPRWGLTLLAAAALLACSRQSPEPIGDTASQELPSGGPDANQKEYVDETGRRFIGVTGPDGAIVGYVEENPNATPWIPWEPGACSLLQACKDGPSRTRCTDGCATCECVDGDWQCQAGDCPGRALCPSKIPIPAAPDISEYAEIAKCSPSAEGQLCFGWSDCSPVCECQVTRVEGHQSQSYWVCQWPDCVCPEERPLTAPEGTTECTTREAICDYGDDVCYRCFWGGERDAWAKGTCSDLARLR